MEKLPGVLLYEIVKYSSATDVMILELFSTYIRKGLISNKSAFSHRISKEIGDEVV